MAILFRPARTIRQKGAVPFGLGIHNVRTACGTRHSGLAAEVLPQAVSVIAGREEAGGLKPALRIAQAKKLWSNPRDALRHQIFACAHPISAFRQPDSAYPQAKTAFAQPDFTLAHLKSAFGNRKPPLANDFGSFRHLFFGCRWTKVDQTGQSKGTEAINPPPSHSACPSIWIRPDG